MLFSHLIEELQKGEGEIVTFKLFEDFQISKGASLDKACKGQISYLESGSYLLKDLSTTNASALLIPNNEDFINKLNDRQISWVSCNQTKLAFAEALELLNPIIRPSEGIHKTAVLGDNIKINEGVYISSHVSIGDNCVIGENTIINPGAVIYENVIIGSNSVLHSNCVLHPKTNIGNNCVIQSNAVIGSEGFGFIPTRNGWRKMPQTGVVVLENNVEIGAGSTIDRPAVGETRIGAGTKIDNLVQIGHGVTTGPKCAMAAQVGVAGGATIGQGVILAGQVGVGNRVKIGDGVIASSKTGVHADINPGQVISGFPAMPNKLWLRCSANFRKLPELAKSLRELTKSSRD